MRLQSAMIYVSDLPRMRAFYRKLLGRDPVNTEWTDTWALFDTGGADFALHQIPTEAIDNPAGAGSRPTHGVDRAAPRETNPVKLTFAVDNVRAERVRLEAMGVPVIQRPWQEPDEACEAVDPEGNIFQLTVSLRSNAR
jgi:catechol 2,3-dioxygenase-like lactoylglutathione lyase family enzyme